jgi:cold shock CspA family protein
MDRRSRIRSRRFDSKRIKVNPQPHKSDIQLSESTMTSSLFSFSLQRSNSMHYVRSRLLITRFFSENFSNKSYLYGTIKFYNRSKAYGFVIPDGQNRDVFVHRKDIVSFVPIQASDTNPYLRKGERIRFQLEKSDGLERAINVTWVSGAWVPALRRHFLGYALERAKSTLGEDVYSTMSDDSLPVEQKNEKVREAFENARLAITRAEQKVVQYGMKLEDFPTIPSTEKRGMYLFPADAEKRNEGDEVEEI